MEHGRKVVEQPRVCQLGQAHDRRDGVARKRGKRQLDSIGGDCERRGILGVLGQSSENGFGATQNRDAARLAVLDTTPYQI